MRKYIFKRLIYVVIAYSVLSLDFFLMQLHQVTPFASEKALLANTGLSSSTNRRPEQPMVYPVQGLPSKHSQVRLRLFHEVPGRSTIWKRHEKRN